MNGRGKAGGELNGFLDAGSHLEGELRFEQTFRVDGKITGKVGSGGDLIVGERGEIRGEIHVARVFVSGRVEGTIEAFERLEIGKGGRVFGDLNSPIVVIEEGATFEGRCQMQRATAPAESAAAPAKVVGRIAAKES